MLKHEYYDLSTANQILQVKAKGSWDDGIAKQYVATFKAAAMPLTQEPWAHLLNLENWELGTPELEPIITELMVWTLQHGLTCFAQVYSPSQLKRYQVSRMGNGLKSMVKYEIFSEEELAFKWLAEQGFK